MSQVITIGSSVIDIFISSPEFKMKQAQEGLMICQLYGDKIEIDDFQLLTGGGGSNTAVGFARLGFKATAISEMGKDVWAAEIQQEYKKEGVNTDMLVLEKREETGKSVILVGPDGGRTILVHRAAASMLDPEDIQSEAFNDATWVHITSLGQLNTLLKIFDLLAQKQVKYSWTPGKNDLKFLVDGSLDPALISAEILILNKEEWQSIESAQDKIQENVSYVVVTDGRNGGEVYQEKECIHTYSLPTNGTPVEETGAGDAFAVGFIAKHIQEKSVEDCVAAGQKNASSVVSFVGAKKGLLREL